jgi:hypothetical protein
MVNLNPPLSREVQTRIRALCEDHLTREEKLLADLLLSLRQVRDAFLERKLDVLPKLQSRQNQLAREATEMEDARDRLRATLADWLGVPVQEVTLRTAALALPPPACDRLLQRRAGLVTMVQEAEQLSQHNAALLGYARAFFTCLFAGTSGPGNSERYSRQGERQAPPVPALHAGAFLESRV